MENPPFILEDNIIKSIEQLTNLSDNNNIGKTILEALSHDPNHIGQIDAETGRTTTFLEMKDKAIRCALWMEKQGLKTDDIVFLFTSNRLDSYTPVFATFFVQAIYSAWGNDVNLDTARYIMKNFAPKIIFASEDVIDILANASKLENHHVGIIVLGKHSTYQSLENITDSQVEHDIKNYVPRDTKNSDETALIILTSGSTGIPKGVMYSSRAFLYNLGAHKNTIAMKDKKRVLWLANLRWVSSISSMLIAILRSATRIITTKTNPQDVCQCIEKYKVNCLITVPFILNSLVKANFVKNYDLSSLVTVVTGGLKVSQEVFNRAKLIFSKAQVCQGYGTTESGFARILPTPNYNQTSSNSIGFITSNMQVKIINRVNGQTVGPHIPGEICIKSSTMMLGYYKNEEATKKIIDTEGWMHTGDVGYFAENGEIFILDRIIDLIKHRGEEIFPYEVENILMTHPSVIEALVVPIPDELDGQRLVVFVHTLPGETVVENEMIELSSKLGESKKLHAVLQLSEHFTIKAGDKISKYQLKEYAGTFFAK